MTPRTRHRPGMPRRRRGLGEGATGARGMSLNPAHATSRAARGAMYGRTRARAAPGARMSWLRRAPAVKCEQALSGTDVACCCRMRRLPRCSPLFALVFVACSGATAADSPAYDGSAPPVSEAGGQVEAAPADVSADRGLDQAGRDEGTDQRPPDGSADQSRPPDQSGLVCEGVDAGQGCGGARQRCCKSGSACGSGLVCTGLDTCEPQPCGGFQQQCCCRAGFPNGCAPDLLCRSGTCGQP
jgi:hypothetical protein